MKFLGAWTTAVLLLLLLLPAAPVDGGQMQQRRRVLVSLNKLSGLSVTSQSLVVPPGANPDLYCSNKCTGEDECHLWCRQPDNTCILSNILVTPAYTETNMTDALPCYTSRPLDLATHANITAGDAYYDNPKKMPTTLVDGVFNYEVITCYYSLNNLQHAWVMFDFGAPVTFSHVLLVAQNNDFVVVLFNDLEVRVGNTAVSAPQGLSSYAVFGHFPGPATPGQQVLMEAALPVRARFLSVQKMSESTGVHRYALQLCHVEVY